MTRYRDVHYIFGSLCTVLIYLLDDCKVLSMAVQLVLIFISSDCCCCASFLLHHFCSSFNYSTQSAAGQQTCHSELQHGSKAIQQSCRPNPLCSFLRKMDKNSADKSYMIFLCLVSQSRKQKKVFFKSIEWFSWPYRFLEAEPT